MIKKYFIDEAGDTTLFSRDGETIVGKEGCSRFFFLGVLVIENPDGLNRELGDLRKKLLNDPYFKNIPSMQLSQRKTALQFHAKDDIPEVRKEVFGLLRSTQMSFLAVVRSKLKVVEYVKQRNKMDATYRYHPNELYDYMIRRLFKNLLHKDEGYDVYFSTRGKGDRTMALQTALETTRARFIAQHHINQSPPINVYPENSMDNGCLQAVDYFLWALQRFYERHEDRYLNFLWPACSLIYDIDDTRTAEYGRYYTQKKPLTLAALDNDTPGI